MDSKHQRVLQLNLPELCHTLDPEVLLAFLPCLSQPTQQEIVALQSRKGRFHAVMKLYDALTCYPKAWNQLMEALRHPTVKLEELADKLDPKPGPEPTKSSPQPCTRSQSPKKPPQRAKTTSCPSLSDGGKRVYSGDTYWGDLNAGVREVLRQLDHEPGPDKLVGELGFSNKEYQDIKIHRSGGSFAIALIEEWNSRERATLGRLMEVIKNIGRLDVLRDLENNTGFKLPGETDDEKSSGVRLSSNNEKKNSGFNHPGDTSGEASEEDAKPVGAINKENGPGRQISESGNSTRNFENAVHNELKHQVPQVLLRSVSPDQAKAQPVISSKECVSERRSSPNARLTVGGHANNMPLDRSLSVDLSVPILTPLAVTANSADTSSISTFPSLINDHIDTNGPIAQTTPTEVQSIAKPDCISGVKGHGRCQILHLSASGPTGSHFLSQAEHSMLVEIEETVDRQQILQPTASAFKWSPFESSSSCVQNNHVIHQESQDQEDYQPVTRKILPQVDRVQTRSEIGQNIHQGPQVESFNSNEDFVLEGPSSHDKIVVHHADIDHLQHEVTLEQDIYEDEITLSEDSMNNNSSPGTLSFPSASNCVSIVRVGKRDGTIKVSDLTEAQNFEIGVAVLQPNQESQPEEVTPMDESLSSVNSSESDQFESGPSYGHLSLSTGNIREPVDDSSVNATKVAKASTFVEFLTKSDKSLYDNNTSSLQSSGEMTSILKKANKFLPVLRAETSVDNCNDESAESAISSGNWISLLSDSELFGASPEADFQLVDDKAHNQNEDDINALSDVLNRGPGQIDNPTNRDTNKVVDGNEPPEVLSSKTGQMADPLDKEPNTITRRLKPADYETKRRESNPKTHPQRNENSDLLSTQNINELLCLDNNCNDSSNTGATVLTEIDSAFANDNERTMTRSESRQSSSMIQTVLAMASRESEFPELKQIFTGVSGLTAFFSRN